MKAKIDEPETKRKMKNIRGLCRGINDFQIGYRARTNIVKDKGGGGGDWLQIPTVFRLGGGNISLSYSMCTGLMMLSRQKNIQQSH